MRPGVSDDFCEFVWSCGGYHIRDIMKRNTPNDMNAARIVNIYLFTTADTPALTTSVAFLKAIPVPGIGTPVGRCGVPSG